MAGTTHSRRIFLAAPAFVAAQAVLVRWAAGEERLPAQPELAQFPDRLEDWRKLADDSIAAEVREQLRADRLLSRTYAQDSTGIVGNLFVAWFQSQRGGLSQPHSPQVCLPGNGWIPSDAGIISLDTAAGTIPVNRYVVSQQGQRAVSMYWYQTPRRVVAGEWETKFWILPDSVRDRRTDTALVRLFVWNGPRTDAEITAATSSLARAAYPVLRNILPR